MNQQNIIYNKIQPQKNKRKFPKRKFQNKKGQQFYRLKKFDLENDIVQFRNILLNNDQQVPDVQKKKKKENKKKLSKGVRISVAGKRQSKNISARNDKGKFKEEQQKYLTLTQQQQDDIKRNFMLQTSLESAIKKQEDNLLQAKTEGKKIKEKIKKYTDQNDPVKLKKYQDLQVQYKLQKEDQKKLSDMQRQIQSLTVQQQLNVLNNVAPEQQVQVNNTIQKLQDDSQKLQKKVNRIVNDLKDQRSQTTRKTKIKKTFDADSSIKNKQIKNLDQQQDSSSEEIKNQFNDKISMKSKSISKSLIQKQLEKNRLQNLNQIYGQVQQDDEADDTYDSQQIGQLIMDNQQQQFDVQETKKNIEQAIKDQVLQEHLIPDYIDMYVDISDEDEGYSNKNILPILQNKLKTFNLTYPQQKIQKQIFFGALFKDIKKQKKQIREFQNVWQRSKYKDIIEQKPMKIENKYPFLIDFYKKKYDTEQIDKFFEEHEKKKEINELLQINKEIQQNEDLQTIVDDWQGKYKEQIQRLQNLDLLPQEKRDYYKQILDENQQIDDHQVFSQNLQKKYQQLREKAVDLKKNLQDVINIRSKFQTTGSTSSQQEQKNKVQIQDKQEQSIFDDIPLSQDEEKKLDEEGNGEDNGNDDGLKLKDFLSLINIGVNHNNQNDLIVIDNDRQQIKFQKPNQIIIFLKDKHYTCAYYDQENPNVINYFDPLAKKERIQRDLKQLQQYSYQIDQDTHCKLKYNTNPWQEQNLTDLEDSDLCGYYCYIFLNNMINRQENFQEATEFDQQDNQLLHRIVPWQDENEFPFI